MHVRNNLEDIESKYTDQLLMISEADAVEARAAKADKAKE